MRLVSAAALFIAALTLATGSTAFAHASYVSSNPAADAVLTAAPTTVTIKFAEHVNPTGSDVVIYDAKHTVVSTGPAQVVQADLFSMSVNMAGDGSEIYLVEWHTVSADDGDPDIGGFVFHVDNTAGAQATATATAKNGGTGGSSKPSGGSGASAWLVALAAILGLLVGAGGVSALRRRV
ncbi:MAG TPA: copper resistance protein CopC [Ktedonobacterales bacterium]|nr:copper resistance protein CopC [Ktedonobacterales bacterium]